MNKKEEMKEGIYPTPYIAGKPRGSIKDQDTSFMAVINTATYETITKSFSYNNDNKEDIMKIAISWAYQLSNKSDITRNQIKFIDKDTLEVNISYITKKSGEKVQNSKSILIDTDKLAIIQKFPIHFDDPNNKYFQVMGQYKKYDFPLVRYLFGYMKYSFKDNNRFNLKESNLENNGEILFITMEDLEKENQIKKKKAEKYKIKGKEKKKKENKIECSNDELFQYKTYNKYTNKEELPEDIFILGRSQGSIIQRKNQKTCTLKFKSVDMKKFNKKINDNNSDLNSDTGSDSDNEKKKKGKKEKEEEEKTIAYKSKQEAEKYKIMLSYRLDKTNNMIKICGNYIEVQIDDMIMITDRIFLDIIQENILNYDDSHRNKYCYISLLGTRKTKEDKNDRLPFHKFITGYETVCHLNKNTLDNRLVNLINFNNTHDNNDELKEKDGKYTVYYTLGNSHLKKKFSGDKHKKFAKDVAWEFREKIKNINFESCFLFEKEKKTYMQRDEITIIHKCYNEFLGKLEELEELEELKDISPHDKIKDNDNIKNHARRITNYKIENIEAKIKQIETILDYKEVNLNNYEKIKKKSKKILNNTPKNIVDIDKILEYNSNDELDDKLLDDIKLINEDQETIDNYNEYSLLYEKLNLYFDYTKSPEKILQQYNDLISLEIPEITTNVVLDEKRVPHYYKEFKTLVQNRDATLLSKEKDYKNAHNKLDVKCKTGHTFSISYNNLKANKWCPDCCPNRMEIVAKCCMEYIFNKKFSKVRPDWLDGLELDMYSEELKLAVEYNGKQHYEFVEYFHKTNDNFKKQQKRDTKKIALCEKRNVELIVIPYNKANENTIYHYILDQLKENNIKFTKPKTDINTSKISFEDEHHLKVLEKIEEREGELLDGLYITKNSLYMLRCKRGHEWTAKATDLLNRTNKKDPTIKGSWCFKCSCIMSDEQKEKISEGMKKYNETDEGKEKKDKAIDKVVKAKKIKKEKNLEVLTHQVCGVCKVEKLIKEFSLKSDAFSGRQSDCKLCANTTNKQKYKHK